jgi:hypothetical protein
MIAGSSRMPARMTNAIGSFDFTVAIIRSRGLRWVSARCVASLCS